MYYELLNLDILIPALAFLGSLKLMDTGITYPDPNTLPKPMLGYRLCKLIQYPDNDAWLFTSAFGTSISWRGKSVAFSTWIAGQARTTGSNLQVSGWLNEANGWDDEALIELVAEGVGYVYIHESGEHPPLTVSEYQDWLTKNAPKVQTSSQQPQVSAG